MNSNAATVLEWIEYRSILTLVLYKDFHQIDVKAKI